MGHNDRTVVRDQLAAVSPSERAAFSVTKPIVLLVLAVTLITGCAQQADLVRLQTALESRIAKLDREKQSLEQSIAETKKEARLMLDQQKADLAELTRARAQIKSELRSLREEELRGVFGNVEKEAHRVDQLGQRVDDVKQELSRLVKAGEQREKEWMAQLTKLTTTIDQQFAQQNQTAKEQLEQFRQSLVEFKNALAGVKEALATEEQRASAEEQKLTGRLETVSSTTTEQFNKINVSIQSLTKALEKATTSLTARLDAQDERVNDLPHVVEAQTANMRQSLASTQKSLDDVTQSLAQLRDALGTTGRTLGQQVDEHSQRLAAFDGRLAQFEQQTSDFKANVQDTTRQVQAITTSIAQLRDALAKSTTTIGQQVDAQRDDLKAVSDRLGQLETHEASLSQKVDADAQALRQYLEEDVKASLNAMLQTVHEEKSRLQQHYDQLAERSKQLEQRSQDQEHDLQELNRVTIQLRETVGTVSGMLGKRGDEQLQQVGRILERMARLEQEQADLQSKQATNAQATSAHLSDVNASLQSVIQSVNQMEESFATQLADQERRLVQVTGSGESVREVEKELMAAEAQVNELTKAVGQLREVVNTIGVKMGERVDRHDQEVAKLANDLQQQADLQAKQVADMQAISSHLSDVNASLQTVIQSVNHMKESFATQLADQEQRLTQLGGPADSVRELEKELMANEAQVNELAKAVSQLRDIVNTIGVKMGERVDRHDQELSKLTKDLQQLKSSKPRN